MSKNIVTMRVELEVDFKDWSLPLDVWWIKDVLCFQVLCFALSFAKEIHEN